MKALLFTTLFGLCLLSVKAPAQIYGITGGPGITALTGNSTIDRNTLNKATFSAGISAHKRFSSGIAIDIGLMYERKGAKFSVDSVKEMQTGQIGSYVTNYNLDYLTLPVMGGYDFWLNKHFLIFGGAGGYAGYLLQQDWVEKSAFAKKYPQPGNYGLLKKTDFGLCAAVKALYILSPKLVLSVGATYSFGLSNISDAPIPNGGQINTRAASLQIGLAWGSLKRPCIHCGHANF